MTINWNRPEKGDRFLISPPFGEINVPVPLFGANSRWFWLLPLVLLLAQPLHSQTPPHLAYALPAGAKLNTTVEVTLGGQYLNAATEARITGPSLTVTLGEHNRPMNGAEAQQLRNRQQDLQKSPKPEDRPELIDIRAKLLLWNAQRLISPTLAETLTLHVTVAPDAAPGQHELRLRTPQGISNPIAFIIGRIPEFTEVERIETVPPPAGQPINQTTIKQSPTYVAVTLPATINGRIKPRLGTLQQQNRATQPFTPGDADRYHFPAKRGQDLVIAAAARELIPYLADAVPGWFQAVLTLYNSKGEEVAYDDDFLFHPDPVIHYKVPEDGDYTIEIRDAIYRGREDFVYRISIGELPYLTSIYPLGGKQGAKTKVTATGWNLPTQKLTVDAKSTGLVPVAASALNPVAFRIDNLPETTAKPGADSPKIAQRLKLPIIVNGRIETPGRWQVFRIDGRAGQTIVAEVEARRLGSPLDSVLRLTDAAGKQLAFNDDFEDKSAGLETHHADSRILTTLPATGPYYLYLGDVQGKAGPEYAYRLRVSPPQPDFEVRVTPSALNLARNMAAVVTAHAIRRDGFTGPITLALTHAPAGLELSGASIPAGESEVRFTLTPTAALRGGQPSAPVDLHFEANATIDGRPVRHPAIPADDRMQAFFYRHLVATAELMEVVRGGSPLPAPAKLLTAEPLRLLVGGTARLQVQIPLPANNPIANLKFELSEPPEGIALSGATPAAGQPGSFDLTINCEPAKLKPGLHGNMIVLVTGERTPPAAANPRPAAAARQRVPLGALPAIPFETASPVVTASVPSNLPG